MSDQSRTPIRADVKVGFAELGHSLGRGAAAVRGGSSREARRRSRSAVLWLYWGRPSDDPAVARQLLIEHRRLESTWTPRFDSWWFRVFNACFVLLWGASLVKGLVDGAPLGDLVGTALLTLAGVFNLSVGPGMMARRVTRTETALVEARALLVDSSATDRGAHAPTFAGTSSETEPPNG